MRGVKESVFDERKRKRTEKVEGRRSGSAMLCYQIRRTTKITIARRQNLSHDRDRLFWQRRRRPPLATDAAFDKLELRVLVDCFLLTESHACVKISGICRLSGWHNPLIDAARSCTRASTVAVAVGTLYKLSQ